MTKHDKREVEKLLAFKHAMTAPRPPLPHLWYYMTTEYMTKRQTEKA